MTTYYDDLKCPQCKIRKMIWIRGTLLCPKCDAHIIWDLQTPWARAEELEWVKKNISVGDSVGRKKTEV